MQSRTTPFFGFCEKTTLWSYLGANPETKEPKHNPKVFWAWPIDSPKNPLKLPYIRVKQRNGLGTKVIQIELKIFLLAKKEKRKLFVLAFSSVNLVFLCLISEEVILSIRNVTAVKKLQSRSGSFYKRKDSNLKPIQKWEKKP